MHREIRGIFHHYFMPLRHDGVQISWVGRDLERDRQQLERQEKQIEAEIRKAGKANNVTAAKTLAKQLIRVRKQKEKSYSMSAQISGVGHRTTAIASTVAISGAMASTAKVMKTANKQMDMQKLQQARKKQIEFSTTMQFEQESMKMDMKEEMMNDAIDGLDDEEDEDESDNIMNQVLDEIGISIGQQIPNAHRSALPSTASKVNAEDDELMRRMTSLKNS
ncbi:hypothetical protein SmJEL517_g02947 [Synchytrium microbalum]|uniref:Charged multivesicular body protein 2B n=1 Tax=Synchytrium microbalum TaxID=1806994 RepID=A0A507C8N1_9FUNG|nr:uncharacterized protein SmJEL517_g02947 [Synchytrium microbalum]TPX34334.1 hypothetical protein SmJEL517_g02947 [Synchytrium microbalum]